MWSYYGRKWKIIKKYPEPKFDTIIEPFVWRYLQQAKSEDILKLPDVENGEFIGDKHLWMCEEERWLMGFSMNNASEAPRHTAGRMNFNSWGRDKIRIARDLHKIKHWKFILGDYRCLKNIKATWFIDPPYQFQKRYKKNKIDYQSLSEWCRSREGQTIVCEQSTADWMDFKPLVQLSGQRTRTTESIWTNSLIQI